MMTDKILTDDSASASKSEEELIEAALRQESGPPIGQVPPPPLPDAIGPYKVIREIGIGGMGVVYEAEQEDPIRRRVAVKVIKLGTDTRAVVTRFEAERQALAMMDHPNIAKVHDAGTTDRGQPYFAMEYVQGARITAYCDEQRLTTHKLLSLFVQVCQAVQHAHQKGTIHRDIKPSNVLVATHDGKPVPKIIDFGVAKATDHRLTEQTLYTAEGQFVGTPEYMSPEQTGFGGQDIDTRTDVYSLGVLLYELLVGVLPHGPTYLKGRSVSEIQRIICEEEPPKPSTRLSRAGLESARQADQRRASVHALRRQLRGELDWITMRALEKDRTRRYGSAADLAADIERYLKHEPVGVGPPSKLYQVRKFMRRHRGLVASLTAVFVVMVAGMAASSMFAISERQARLQTQQQTYALRIAAAQAALTEHNVTLARQRLTEAFDDSPDLCNWEWNYVQAACDESLATLRGHEDNVLALAIHPDGRLLASGSQDSTVRIWHLSSGAELHCLREHRGSVNAVAFSPHGRFLATCSHDKTVRLWDILRDTAPAVRSVLEGHEGWVLSVAFSPDGKTLASGSADNTVRLWDVFSGEKRAELKHESYVRSLAFSPDGARLATGSWADMRVHLWDLDTREELWNRELRGGVYSLAFSSDGKYLASGSQDPAIYVFDTSTGEPWRILRGHTTAVYSVDFEPSGDVLRLVSASRDSTIRLWDVSTSRTTQLLRGHDAIVSCAKFGPNPDSRCVVSASWDKTIRIWDASTNGDPAILGRHGDEVRALAFSPDGTRLASGTQPQDKTHLRIWDLRTGDLRVACEEDALGAVRSVAFSPDGTRLASGSTDKVVRIWDAQTGRQLLRLPGHTGHINGVAFSPDGMRLASGASDKTVRVWDATTGEALDVMDEHDDAVLAVAFSPDGRRLASASWDNTVRIWDTASGETLVVMDEHDGGVLAVAFSPDGTRVASGSADMTVRLWDASTGEVVRVLRGSRQPVSCVAFSPDGRRLASGSGDKAVYVWNADTGEGLLQLSGHGNPIRCLAFSPDGTRLASGARDWTIRLWDAVPRRVRYEERQAAVAAKEDRHIDAGGTVPASPAGVP